MHHKIEDGFSYITEFYGITQDPETKNYMMVLDYAENGSLRNYLDKNFDKLSWRVKFRNLHLIAVGLMKIHEKELIHRDLHIGNILTFFDGFDDVSGITDLGLCRPADDKLKNANNHIYG